MKGKELLSAYYHTPPRPLQDAEVSFQVPLVNPTTGEVLEVPLRGVIDLVEANDTVIEFKTSQKRWALADLPDNVQLTAYSYAYELPLKRADPRIDDFRVAISVQKPQRRGEFGIHDRPGSSRIEKS